MLDKFAQISSPWSVFGGREEGGIREMGRKGGTEEGRGRDRRNGERERNRMVRYKILFIYI